MDDNTQHSLQSIKKTYISRISSKITVFNQLDEAFSNKNYNEPILIKEVLNLTHMFIGSGATFGFPEITDKARILEQHLININLDNTDKIKLSLKDFINSCLNLVKTYE